MGELYRLVFDLARGGVLLYNSDFEPIDLMKETPEAVHLSQEPHQEKVLAFSDQQPRAYGVFVNEELEVSLLSHGAFIFAKEPGKPLERAHPNDRWERGSMILANQGGRWVMTADPDEDVTVLDEVLTKQDRVAMKVLIEKACRGAPVTETQSRVKTAALSVLLGMAAGTGLTFLIMKAGTTEFNKLVGYLNQIHSTPFLQGR